MSRKHASLSHPPANLVSGDWVELPASSNSLDSIETVESRSPAAPTSVVWSAACPMPAVNDAVHAARRALPAWSQWGLAGRSAALRRFAELCKEQSDAIAAIICDETGKAMWEAKGEAAALAAKVDITLDESPIGGLARVRGFEFGIGPKGQEMSKLARCSFKPHGVMAVLGPFNFPAHLPNGHIVPALAMGNTVVFKPSDKAPAVGQMLAELFERALRECGAPNDGRGIINLVQGGPRVASALASHDGIDGVLFTGSWPVGRRILEANLDRPGRIIALELGGSNPAVVMPDADLRQAAIEIARCAFNTTGQRCTCTRRVIVHRGAADRLINAVVRAAGEMKFGHPRSAGVFAGPIINETARQAVFNFQERCARTTGAKAGARVLLASSTLEVSEGPGWYLSPSVIAVERFNTTPFDPKSADFDPGCDHEVFGPLLRVAIVDDLDSAIEQANATRYGLAASIFTRKPMTAERFLHECRAGCLNVNAGTAGASSKLPFGGLGLSGNHRPAGSFSLDYCAYPVAGMEEKGDAAQIAEGMAWDDAWLS
ncbi:MAG: aldehyde dehydrogenase family protein [Phycisphaeraceae bacterium]|nr:aldehyde dehydrogenase family protein [Phycisphaeraceae bacterium]